ncbi:hypothetical protein [Streptomyces sp. CAU 1734]|uniref:hypothetical protein n=1 Tax=Streptomyces sp. CAU 1734 TaxID=3140360 RepID=UPI003260283B
MKYYRDVDNDLWITGKPGLLHCAEYEGQPNSYDGAGRAQAAEMVNLLFGPLREVRPTGWENV